VLNVVVGILCGLMMFVAWGRGLSWEGEFRGCILDMFIVVGVFL
jgi:hypothetical protein